MPQKDAFYSIPITQAATGTIIAAVTGRPIKVWGFALTAAGAVTIQFGDNSGTPNLFTGVMSLVTGVPLLAPYDGSWQFYVLPGKALVLTLGGSVQVSGWIRYSLG